ncbi:MAG: AAA-like domain-containing protein [Bacteroidales bacterium]|nr:AAA-like domain-containing protein [Bacteroidales bacterium]
MQKFIHNHFKRFIMRYFNTSGPCNKAEHYMIEAASRLQGVEQLIDMKQYFVIHAARQSGKTTYLKDLAERLNAEGKYHALYCSLESLQSFSDVREGIPEIVKLLQKLILYSNIPNKEKFAENADYTYLSGVLNMSLTLFCMKIDKPLVILFDEADCLKEDTLITFLRQLREGYNSRSDIPFVHSIALVGMRNIRDYKAQVRPESQSLGSASPFNIVTKTYTLENFTKEEITALYQQHTEETGQLFEQEAIDFIYKQTQGQPWLVNAAAREVIVEMLQSDYTQPVTAKLADEAIQTIILRRDTHIDSLLERLKEERVRKIIEPMVMGGDQPIDRLSDDYQYVCDLGLIKSEGRVMPSNPIYGEVIARHLSLNYQNDLDPSKYPYRIPRYLRNGLFDMDYLMQDFQQFWRENSAIWKKKYQYQEAAPHLILMAFLQRILNGGGYIIREMAAGSGRTDLCIVYEGRKYPIELKIRRGDKTLSEGIEQTMQYMDTLGATEGWLAIFDQRHNIAWNDKIYMHKETAKGKTITVVGL